MTTAQQPSSRSTSAGDAAATVAENGPQSRLSMIAQIADRLARSLDFGQAMEELIDAATDLLDVERGAVLLLDQSTRTLSVTVACGLDEEARRASRVQVGFGIAGAVAETGRPLIQKRLPAGETGPGADRLDSGLCVPIAVHGKLLGAMSFEEKRGQGRFQKDDLEFAQLVANQAALSLYCDLLHEEFTDELAQEEGRPEDGERSQRRLAAA
jgi:GAF domain-containing protein